MPRSAKRKLSFSAAMPASKARKDIVQDVQIKKLKKAVNRLKGAVDVKQYNGATTITPTTTVQSLATGAQLYGIIQGIDAENRIGNKITLTRVRFDGTLAATVAQTVYLALVMDKQCGGADITPQQVFGATSAENQMPQMVRNPEFLERYTILASKKLVFNPQEQSAVPLYSDLKSWSMDIKRRIVVRYDATAGAITDLAGVNIRLLYMSFGSTATSTGQVWGTFTYEDE